MSYILEALRRADAQRQRGAVPGLHDQVGGAPTPPGEAPPRLTLLGMVLAAVVMVLAGATGAWWWAAGRVPLDPPAAPMAQTAPAPAAVLPAPPLPDPAPSSDRAAPIAPMPAAQPPATQAHTPSGRPVVPPAPVQPAWPAAPPPVAAAKPRPTVAKAQPASGPKAASAADTAGSGEGRAGEPSVAALPARLPQLADLPDALRREMAGLRVNGSVYAEQPAARMVILNGQVFHEGDSPATDLRIEQIRPRSLVLNLRGQRFEMPM